MPQLAKDLIYESMKIFQRLPLDQRVVFESLSTQQMTGDLLSAMIEARGSKGNDATLETWLTARAIRQPWRCDANKALAEWLKAHNRAEDASRLRESAKAWPCPPLP